MGRLHDASRNPAQIGRMIPDYPSTKKGTTKLHPLATTYALKGPLVIYRRIYKIILVSFGFFQKKSGRISAETVPQKNTVFYLYRRPPLFLILSFSVSSFQPLLSNFFGFTD
jgi:hypothetical protein